MPTLRRARVALAVVAAACSGSGTGSGNGVSGPLDFTIGGIAFHVSSGAVATVGGVLTLFLTDQPDGCQAITYTPVGTATIFSLGVAAAADGTTSATVVAPKPAPAAGEAVGKLVRATGGVSSARLDAADGSVSWKSNADGSVTITSVDVGFAGAAGRLTTVGLTVPHC